MVKKEEKKGGCLPKKQYLLLFWSSNAWKPLSRPGEKAIKTWKKPQALPTIPIRF